jgi:hypothetical protein
MEAMMRNYLIGVLSLAAIACSPAAEKPAAPPPPPPPPAPEVQLRAGLWRTTITPIEIKNPAIPPELAKAMLGKAVTVEDCQTQADIATFAKGWSGQKTGMTCADENYSVVNGQITGKATCKSGGVTMRMAMTGTQTATRVEADSAVTMVLPNGEMFTRSKVVAERVGECKA